MANELPAKYRMLFDVPDLKGYSPAIVYNNGIQGFYILAAIPENGTFLMDSVLYAIDKISKRGGFVDGAIGQAMIEGSKEVWRAPDEVLMEGVNV